MTLVVATDIRLMQKRIIFLKGISWLRLADVSCLEKNRKKKTRQKKINPNLNSNWVFKITHVGWMTGQPRQSADIHRQSIKFCVDIDYTFFLIWKLCQVDTSLQYWHLHYKYLMITPGWTEFEQDRWFWTFFVLFRAVGICAWIVI